MKELSEPSRMERIVSGLLWYGTLFASGCIAIGMLLGHSGGAAFGIVLLIAMPVVRVALTTAIFLFLRDYLFAVVSAVVLAMIVLGFFLGTGGPH